MIFKKFFVLISHCEGVGATAAIPILNNIFGLLHSVRNGHGATLRLFKVVDLYGPISFDVDAAIQDFKAEFRPAVTNSDRRKFVDSIRCFSTLAVCI